MQMRVLHNTFVVELDRDLPMPFDPCNTINFNRLHESS